MRRMLRIAPLVALAALAGPVPVASADHVQPTVTASLVLGKPVKDCDSHQVCGGSRRATISWSASCGPGVGPEALETVEVAIQGIRPSGRRFDYDGEAFDSEQVGLTDSVSMIAGPGLRFTGVVKVTCFVQTVNADGDPVDHRGSATATTGELFLPPRTAGFSVMRGTWCGVNLTGNQSSRILQAGQYFDVAWFMRYSGASLFKSGVPAKRQVKLFGRGAGTSFRRFADPGILRNYGEIGTWVRPRRGGTLKIWAVIGGKKTNTLSIRVLPKRC
jgi:hypothetical protein